MLPIKIDLPSGFLDEQVRDGYLISHEMKEVWAVELDLLNEFKRVCDKNNIRWFGDAGTILGAARHGGIIPWDDDIDVMMLRDDYENFLKVASDEFKYPYFLQTDKTDFYSLRGHAQLRNSQTTAILTSEKDLNATFNQGIFLDIFPIDRIPESEEVLRSKTDNILRLKCSMFDLMKIHFDSFPANKNNAFIIELARRLKYYLFTLPSVNKKIHKLYSQFEVEIINCDNPSAEHLAKLVLVPFKPRRLWKSAWFDTTTYLKFEMFQLPVPSGYEELLDTFYGNWREFVIGTASHGQVFFDTHNSYTKYIGKR